MFFTDAHKGQSCSKKEKRFPTDAHKGLPYYTLMHATHAVYSRVAPCGRPLVLSSAIARL